MMQIFSSTLSHVSSLPTTEVLIWVRSKLLILPLHDCSYFVALGGMNCHTWLLEHSLFCGGNLAVLYMFVIHF